MLKTFEFRTESSIRSGKWESILKEKGIKYNHELKMLANFVHIFTIQAEDQYYTNETNMSDWELYDDHSANLKYICGLLCIPYEDVKFTYKE